MEPAELLILLLISVAAFGLVARRTGVPDPIILVLGGLAVSFIPGLPRVELAPDYVFLIVLPPLLYAQAWFTSWKEFRENLQPILMLAVGLVLLTMTAVALVAYYCVPGLPLAAAFVLGAVVSPPDAVAASAIANRLRLPKRLVTILEGESLVNDATGLVAYKFALVAVATGSFSFVQASGGFLLAVIGGIGIGLVMGWLFLKLLQSIRDDFIDIVLSLVTPYAAFVTAERLHCSGVLATVTAGIYLGAHSPEFLSASTRLTGTAFWNTLVFLLNGVVFMLIGLQLPGVIRGLHHHEWSSLLMDVVWIGGIVILVRILWVFPGAWLPRQFSAKSRARIPMPRWNNIAIVAWCGMRGVVSLAAALAVPKLLPDGREFPERDLVLFFTFAVILITLVGQGLSLPWLIRRLRVETAHSEHEQERAARRTAAEAALQHIKKAGNDHGLATEVCESVAAVYQERLHHLSDELAETLGWSPTRQRSVEGRRLRREALHAERTHIIALHRQAHLSKDLLHKLERELDLEEARLG